MQRDDEFCNKAEAFEALDDSPRNSDLNDTLGDIINRRYGRRDVLTGMLGVSAIMATMQIPFASAFATSEGEKGKASFYFDELASGIDTNHHIADGYNADILLRWGDPIFSNAPAFDPLNQSAEKQLQQFGYNNDYLGFLPLEGSDTRGLLCINHEYTSEEVMFPEALRKNPDKALTEIEMAAHGGTVIEILFKDGKWQPVLESKYNRRISTLKTEMVIDGPASGDDRLKTKEDPTGKKVIGTVNNCAGGMTPWGTYLMAEENFHGYFYTDQKDEKGEPQKGLGGDQAKSYKRYGIPSNNYLWGKFHDRFNVDKEANECNRFGWIVEVDPMDPNSTPVKHTALGRFYHEGSECIINKDGHAVVYSGDDARFEFVYRFVSQSKFNKDDRQANMSLLSEGTLSVARFQDDGKVIWLPLVHGQEPLTAENGFKNQAEVLIDARLAATLLGATPMDRPEDVQPHQSNGKVFIMLTNNNKRKSGDTNLANPRAENDFGHVIEMQAPDADHAANEFTWTVLVKCGNPKIAEVGAQWHPETSDHGWFGSPDNCAIDALGRLWISTDQGKEWAKTGKADGLYAVETEGSLRGKSKLFFRCPVGAELCGPYFTPDDQTLFVAVQHPGTDGTKDFKGFERASTFEDPATRWPETDPASKMPPRPSVVVIRKKDGGKIASV